MQSSSLFDASDSGDDLENVDMTDGEVEGAGGVEGIGNVATPARKSGTKRRAVAESPEERAAKLKEAMSKRADEAKQLAKDMEV